MLNSTIHLMVISYMKVCRRSTCREVRTAEQAQRSTLLRSVDTSTSGFFSAPSVDVPLRAPSAVSVDFEDLAYGRPIRYLVRGGIAFGSVLSRITKGLKLITSTHVALDFSNSRISLSLSPRRINLRGSSLIRIHMR